LLLEFRNQYPEYQHTPSMDMLRYAGTEGIIKDISFAHGGDCLYEVMRLDEKEMAVWHEDLIEEHPTDAVRANTVYKAYAELRDARAVVVIRDSAGQEYLVKRIDRNSDYALSVNHSAAIRTIQGFERRYDFEGAGNERQITTD
jgi:hypothetical protein